jgi:hypothetical protein
MQARAQREHKYERENMRRGVDEREYKMQRSTG